MRPLRRRHLISEGLLPEDPTLNKVFRYVNLESGLVTGLELLAIGVAGSVAAFASWKGRSFGNLDPTRTLRLVISSAFTFMLGCQTILSSFFLSVLGLRVRRY